jgi:hypothetical protein
MKLFRSARWVLMALVLSIVPASAFAGVFISVGFAPPVLPVYDQPPVPEPGLLWTPGYWAYGEDGYFWVPGAWVPAPYEGALWTPGYWGWGEGLYVWHPGYWGDHVGYYGGVNYGFGYLGIGFVGGVWRGHDFEYNRAVVRVNERDERFSHNTYVDRTVIVNHTIANDRHVAFSGGPGGINHAPNDEERAAMHEQHRGATPVQSQHVAAARGDHGSYFKANGGHPQTLAVARPAGAPNNSRGGQANSFNNQSRQQPQNQGRGQYQDQNRPAPQAQPRNESRPEPQQRPESRPAPQQRPESRPAPQSRPQSKPQHEQSRPKEDHKG